MSSGERKEKEKMPEERMMGMGRRSNDDEGGKFGMIKKSIEKRKRMEIGDGWNEH